MRRWSLVASVTAWIAPILCQETYFDKNLDGSPFLWLLEDDYHGNDFFEGFQFFTGDDPTNGMVRYVPKEEAFGQRLAYVQDDGVVIVKADDTSELALGQYRSSVRISTIKEYTTGLFILDLNTAPWGCGVWPAWWTTATYGWPANGEIDIIEGVHDNEHNQIAWHTEDGCYLSTNQSFTGTISDKNGAATNCNAHLNKNAGCSVTEWSRASYGPDFDSHGGGVFVMKWDENGISVWSFYRSAVPKDIIKGSPNPSSWEPPAAILSRDACDIEKYFRNHTIIINITFCGDWAGNSYATSGCPGTCQQRLMDPKNFVNATWSINSMKVYAKQTIVGRVVNPNGSLDTPPRLNWFSWLWMGVWAYILAT